jgi:hypothetical protein
MKTDGTDRKTSQPFLFPYFITRNGSRIGIAGERERKRDIRITETDENRKVYRNVLLFNHHLA